MRGRVGAKFVVDAFVLSFAEEVQVEFAKDGRDSRFTLHLCAFPCGRSLFGRASFCGALPDGRASDNLGLAVHLCSTNFSWVLDPSIKKPDQSRYSERRFSKEHTAFQTASG